ncbi:DnaD domain-containing protein [Salinibacillus xinjiangensis]|uniref:DnaD domain protein n=1 Tax=Salinibacillus xinjiangensis TaxID=1229268 RepID=A0A6G1XBM5_9BACI|nr:DnaD domain-containing protein [Salinibacillus xinjiangensis]MRG88280.1 DnaD domain protein [Salinibacillus xinjiangensis]
MPDKSFFYHQLLFDQMTLPKSILLQYQSLGLNENELAVILQIYRLQSEGSRLPSIQDISQYMSLKEHEVAQSLKKLMKNGFLKIEQYQEDHIINEWYSLEPLWKKLYNTEQIEEHAENEGNLFLLFEQEFGRALSPIEIETINHWLDDDRLVPALIKAALREAVLMGKLNFRYVDRILIEWTKKGVKTVEDARKVSQSFRQNVKPGQPKKEKRDTSVYYNWLDEEGE